MTTIKVGVREFRERIASFLESDTPIAVTRRGETLGVYVPTRRKRLQTREPSCESYSDVGRVATELKVDYVLGAKSTIIKRAIGMCPPISKLITSPYASGRKYTVESRSHSLSDVRKDRNNAAQHTAETAVASHRVAEIE